MTRWQRHRHWYCVPRGNSQTRWLRSYADSRSVCTGRASLQCVADSYHDQKMGLKKGCHVMVKDTRARGQPSPERTFRGGGVIGFGGYEADRILDMGFIERVTTLLQRCPNRRQTLLFSTTFPRPMTRLCATIQTDAAFVSVDAQVDQAILQQQVVRCLGVRNQTLVQVLAHHRPEQAVFCETRRDCESIARFLSDRGAVALPLHGQMERDRTMRCFDFSMAAPVFWWQPMCGARHRYSFITARAHRRASPNPVIFTGLDEQVGRGLLDWR